VDVGPTVGDPLRGRPATDDRIEFEDLILFGINFNSVSKDYRTPAPVLAGRLALEVPDLPAVGQSFTADLVLAGDGTVQALSVPVAWDATVLELVGVESGDLLARQGGEHVVLTRDPGFIDAALLGVRPRGISGEGVLARATFRVVGAGDPALALGTVRARSATNRPVDLSGEVVSWVPRTTQLHPNAPNPFNPQTSVVFDIATPGDVRLRVYGVDGRLVRTLVAGHRAPGRYTSLWNGKDDRGRAVASGVYLLRLETAGFAQGRKITLVR
jgi:hypothetical protein